MQINYILLTVRGALAAHVSFTLFFGVGVARFQGVAVASVY